MDSLPVSRVVNAQPEGIGRIAALGAGCAWNNLGRNVVFADTLLRPVAVFGDTDYPDEAETSEFDLDVHAIVELAGTGQIAVLNHLGSVRIFPVPPAVSSGPVGQPDLEPSRRFGFLDDLERTVGLGDRLVTSRPRGRRLDGVLVTEPVPSARGTLGAEPAHESFGFVTALAARSTPDGTGWVALGGDGRVRVVGTERGRLGPTRWERPVDFLTSVLTVDGPSLWAAGSALGGADLDDYDWERLGGGGLARFDLATGDVVTAARFGADLAWGSGGVPFVVAGGMPVGVGRRGELHVLPPGAGVTTELGDDVAPRSLGIAHAAVVGDQLLIGFNRGGYRLRAIPRRHLTRQVGKLPLRRA